ncbi:hypothetical protein J6TS7_32280 [Paenibacillus dendritiformis]|uniref:hypothetical protein n=1 Tax=Paenibacillus TaxID=44249 RepID=UPI001B27CE42|nr:hypothetical protein [Paenibacillus dendritiformis]GIO79618.1 hypothetical protein J6TS7_32280 [Paenibacillus dendritiformis]
MGTLNSLFIAEEREKSEKVIQPELKKKSRKTRSDKLKMIKFPVNEEQREQLRRRAKENVRVLSRKETIYNTKCLIEALDQASLFPERYPELIYKYSGQYMHVKVTLDKYEVIEEFAFRWGCSVRKATHRLLLNYCFLGEVRWSGLQPK